MYLVPLSRLISCPAVPREDTREAAGCEPRAGRSFRNTRSISDKTRTFLIFHAEIYLRTATEEDDSRLAVGMITVLNSPERCLWNGSRVLWLPARSSLVSVSVSLVRGRRDSDSSGETRAFFRIIFKSSYLSYFSWVYPLNSYSFDICYLPVYYYFLNIQFNSCLHLKYKHSSFTLNLTSHLNHYHHH